MTARTYVTRLVGLSLLGISLTGCVSQEKYNALKLAHDGLVERIGEADRESQAAKAEAEAYKQQLAMFGQNGNSKDAMLANLSQQNAQLQQQLDEINRRYAEAMNRPGIGAALPAPLTNVLEQFAAQNPDLVDFDANRGIVKFRSDVTFATGSAEVTPQARTAIARFAQILNSPDARGYELLVAGHTDNQKVSNPATIKAGHLDNWYLSAHRAIAVSTDLQRNQVDPQRLGVVGYADQRPAASNATSQGKQQNRRVEVLILPNTVRTGVARGGNTGSAPAPAPARTTRRQQPNLNKDTPTVGATDQGPSYNK
jgi:chemotaxis protein MotB